MQTIMVFQRTKDIIGFAQENASWFLNEGRTQTVP